MLSCPICDLIGSPKLMIQDTKTMNITRLTEKINAVFEPKKLFELAREKNFNKNLGRKRPSFKTSLADLNVFLSDLVQ